MTSANLMSGLVTRYGANSMIKTTYGLTRGEYAAYRRPFTPANPKIIFVCESPPISGKYFYNPDGMTSEPLFAAMMSDVVGVEPKTKVEGLTAFAAEGYLLLDATYVPVNVLGSVSARNRAAALQIQNDLPKLIKTLRQHVRPDTQIVLVKANVCRLLEEPLKQQGFAILNCGRVIAFPSTGQQGKFRQLIREVLPASSTLAASTCRAAPATPP